MLLQTAMDVGLLDQWVAFCKRATPGTRYWIDDELWDRLYDRLARDARVMDMGMSWYGTYRINYRGGHEYSGLTF